MVDGRSQIIEIVVDGRMRSVVIGSSVDGRGRTRILEYLVVDFDPPYMMMVDLTSNRCSTYTLFGQAIDQNGQLESIYFSI